MAGLTSQPSANSLYYAIKGSQRKVRADIEALEKLSYYWEDVRHYYKDFESGMMSRILKFMYMKCQVVSTVIFSSRQKQLALAIDGRK